jgi:hypothetical protein
MKKLKILIDPSFPPQLVDSLKEIHDLQDEKKFEIHSWAEGIEEQFSLSESIFLAVEHSKRGLSEVVVKQLEEGYRMFLMRLGTRLDFFEFAMTVLRVWPFIIEKAEKSERNIFCYTFRYGGRKLKQVNWN